MHSTAQKCVTWSIALFVLGTLVMIWGGDIYLAVSDRAGGGAAIGIIILDHVWTFTRNAVYPLAAVLVGAAVVIQALTKEITEPPAA